MNLSQLLNAVHRIHGLREVLLAPAVIAIVLRQIFRGSANSLALLQSFRLIKESSGSFAHLIDGAY